MEMKAYTCHSCEVNYKAYSPSCHSCEVSLRANAGISIFKLDKISFMVSRFKIIDSGICSQNCQTGMTAENLLSKTRKTGMTEFMCYADSGYNHSII